MKHLIILLFLLAGLNSYSQNTFKITKIWSNGNNTFFTDVTYSFNGKEVSVSIPHFKPASKAEVVNNIKQRALSERAALSADSIINILLPIISVDTAKVFQLP